MVKHKPTSQNRKVIPFPNLGQRLIEKGLEYLQNKQFKQAVPLFEEALQMNGEDKDTYLGLVIAYFELGRLDEAKKLAQEMLETGIGDYFEILDLYMMILVQLHQYDELQIMLEALFEEREIPFEKREHLSQMHELSRKMMLTNDNPSPNIVETDEPHPLFLEEQELNEQIVTVTRIAHENIRLYIEEIKNFLTNETGHPFIKTLLLNVLREQEYNQELVVCKLDKQCTVIPVGLPDFQSQPFMNEIIALLSKRIESDNPTLFEHAKQIVERCFLISYPFELNNLHADIWAVAFHYIVLTYFGVDETMEEFSEQNGIEFKHFEEAIQFINKCEEISSPII